MRSMVALAGRPASVRSALLHMIAGLETGTTFCVTRSSPLIMDDENVAMPNPRIEQRGVPLELCGRAETPLVASVTGLAFDQIP